MTGISSGDRWSGYLKLVDNPKYPHTLGHKGVMNSCYDDGPGRADIAVKADVVLEELPVPFAVIHEGKVYSKGDMGWFGVYKEKMSEAEWIEWFRKFIEELSDNTQLTVVDMHI
jgi:hypothetical protein